MSAVTVIDRRTWYYGRIGHAIAADALAFYVRVEEGRRIQQTFPWQALPSPPCPGSGLAGVEAPFPDPPDWTEFGIAYEDAF